MMNWIIFRWIGKLKWNKNCKLKSSKCNFLSGLLKILPLFALKKSHFFILILIKDYYNKKVLNAPKFDQNYFHCKHNLMKVRRKQTTSCPASESVPATSIWNFMWLYEWVQVLTRILRRRFLLKVSSIGLPLNW